MEHRRTPHGTRPTSSPVFMSMAVSRCTSKSGLRSTKKVGFPQPVSTTSKFRSQSKVLSCPLRPSSTQFMTTCLSGRVRNVHFVGSNRLVLVLFRL